MMRDARPTEVWYFKLKRNAEGKAEPEMGQGATDWAWLDDVDREGYDPRGATGPTYWRVTETHYYSVFPNPRTGQLMLLISDVAKKETDAGLYDDFVADHPDCHAAGEETLERRIHPWLSLSFQISPAASREAKPRCHRSNSDSLAPTPRLVALAA